MPKLDWGFQGNDSFIWRCFSDMMLKGNWFLKVFVICKAICNMVIVQKQQIIHFDFIYITWTLRLLLPLLRESCILFKSSVVNILHRETHQITVIWQLMTSLSKTCSRGYRDSSFVSINTVKENITAIIFLYTSI